MSRFTNHTDGTPGPEGPAGPAGSAASLYYGSFFDELQQDAGQDTIQAMRLRTTDFANGISISGTNNTRITMGHTGKYNIAFSAQLHQTNSSSIVNIWLAKNGTAMAWTNTKASITANNPFYVAAWNFFVDATAGDYYEIMWSSNSDHTVLEVLAPTGTGANLHPAVPSVIATVNQVG
jgi:hypothetical protein